MYMHLTVSRQGTSTATATTTIDLCVLSTNSVPKLLCHTSCSHAFPYYAVFTLLAFLLYFCGFSHTRLNFHCSTVAELQRGRDGGRGSVEKFFSFARTHRKRYFIEFFVAQSESAPKIVVGTKFSISFSILVHLPATVATTPPRPRRLLLIYFVVGKFFLRTLLVFVGFA